MTRTEPTPTTRILEALAVTAEICGAAMTPGAARAVLADLEQYPVEQVLKALARCRRELQGRLTLAAILARIEQADGRPAADAAWALVWPCDEARTLVAPDEALQAVQEVSHLEETAARMAFRARYEELVREAREVRRPVHWAVSLGTDPEGRRRALARAEETGRLPPGEAQRLLGEAQAAPAPAAGLLPGRTAGLSPQAQRRLLLLLSRGSYREAESMLGGGQ